jgi:hypothetical protein
MPKTTQGFLVTHAKDAPFEKDLRSFLEYRDLELKRATQGGTVNVIFAAGGKELMLKQRAPAAA